MRTAYLLIFFLFLSGACNSPKNKSEYELAATSQAPTLAPGDPLKGKSLYPTCAVCHGQAGEGSDKMHAPALANVDGWYMYRQLMHFRKGIRGSDPSDTLGVQMAAMAKTLADSVAVNDVVAYVLTFPSVIVPVVVHGDPKKGEQYYQTICGSCHGPKGTSNEKMNAPRLVGLQDWYIERQVKHFRSSLRGVHPGDTFGAQMVPMVALLPNDQAIRDVIAYIRSSGKEGTR